MVSATSHRSVEQSMLTDTLGEVITASGGFV
jgi:hypothetical protein